MATISVSCHFCGRTFEVPSSMVGETTTCECGSSIQVRQSQAESSENGIPEPPPSVEGSGKEDGPAPSEGWYIYEDGESVGPKKLSELRRLIQSGEVGPSQKVYHQSLSEWRPVSSLSYLRADAMPKPEGPAVGNDSEDRKWYVRVGGSKYGPYSNARVQKMLDKNQLRPDSQIWSSELAEWNEVQNVEPFASSLIGDTSSKAGIKSNDKESPSPPSESPLSEKNVKKAETKEEETTHNDTTTRSKKRKKETTKTGLTTNLKGLFQRGGKNKTGGAQVPSTVLTVEYVDDTEGIETYLKDIVRTLEGLQEQTDQVQQYVSRLARAVNQQKKQEQQSIKALQRRLDRLYSQIEKQAGQAPVAEQMDVSLPDSEKEVEEEFGVPDEYSNDDAHQRAWQVAEVMASDLEAYHSDELEEAVMYGNLEEVLGEPIAEARETYQNRTPGRVREEIDYFDMALRELMARKKMEMNQEEVS